MVSVLHSEVALWFSAELQDAELSVWISTVSKLTAWYICVNKISVVWGDPLNFMPPPLFPECHLKFADASPLTSTLNSDLWVH